MKEETRKLLINRWQTPDGTILESRDRHDFVSHVDANGTNYYVDGGTDYIRLGNHEGLTSMCVYVGDSHSVLREALRWGSRGVDGNQPLKRIKICDMEESHLEAVIKLPYVDLDFRDVMEAELEFRTFSKNFNSHRNDNENLR